MADTDWKVVISSPYSGEEVVFEGAHMAALEAYRERWFAAFQEGDESGKDYMRAKESQRNFDGMVHAYRVLIKDGDWDGPDIILQAPTKIYSPEAYRIIAQRVTQIITTGYVLDATNYLLGECLSLLEQMFDMGPGNYYVCWYDPADKKRGVVAGEGPMQDWAETREVVWHFQDEGDGLQYYVGNAAATPMEPTKAEAEEIRECMTDERNLPLTTWEEECLKRADERP